MKRSAQWLPLVGMLVLACGPSDPSSDKDESTEVVELRQNLEPTDTPQVATDKALVQVAIDGMAVFQMERDHAGKLVGLSAFLPNVTGHKRILERGFNDGGRMRWEQVTEDDAKHPINLGGKTIRIKVLENLGEIKGASIGSAYPNTPTEAQDIGWMLQAKEIDDPTSFQPGTSARVNFGTGILETCALVYPNKDWDTVNKACKVKVDNDKGVERSSSEIMVVRGTVLMGSSGSASVVVELDDGMQVQKVTIPATGVKSVDWNGMTYNVVVDVGISNRYFDPGRKMKSDHADIHLKPLFQGGARSWKMESTDCPSESQCSCKEHIQPPCWTEYFAELYGNSPSGWDRPICPFIGWTP